MSTGKISVIAGLVIIILSLGGWVWSMDEHRRDSEQIIDDMQRSQQKIKESKAVRHLCDEWFLRCLERGKDPQDCVLDLPVSCRVEAE